MKRILKLSSIFHFICLLVFFDNLFCEDLPKPRGVFSAVFWEKYNSNSFSYAPWGNENDENASIVNISVGASSLSRPFVYYGDKKISFYEKIRPREWEDIDSDSDDQPLGKLAAEFEFPKDDSGDIEYLLLFINKKKNGLWNIYPIPFPKSNVPMGSYKFISQANNEIYLLFGKEKVTLSPGQNKVAKAILENGKRGINLRAMIQRNGKYFEVFNQRFGHSNNMRGIFFLSLDKNKMNVKKLVQFNQSIESASGFGLPPVKSTQESNIELN